MLAAEVTRYLAHDAERVCRLYLPAGRRCGAYWTVGNVAGAPGDSLYVRLHGPDHGKGAAGRWTDAATGEHGDLLDLLAATCRFATMRQTLDEARSFLALPRKTQNHRRFASSGDLVAIGRRLFAASRPVGGTLAEAYLEHRGLAGMSSEACLRFHPNCTYRPTVDESIDTPTAWPALIAAVVDLHGAITGVQRTWLDPSGTRKASIRTPRRAMGQLAGNGVRFGSARDVMAAGEGIETVLSLRAVCPALPTVAALSASHLSALQLPSTLRRLYIIEDRDQAGREAADSLSTRARATGIEVLKLEPALSDLNEDLTALGRSHVEHHVRSQLVVEDTRYVSRRR